MGSELVSSLLPPSPGDDEKKHRPSHTEIFEQHFPYYLAIGMTAAEYWNGDSTLVRAFREADRIRMERMNQEKWLQGAYIYEAICAASPTINAMSKRSKPFPYPEKPYSAIEKPKKVSKHEAEKQEMLKQKAKLENMMSRINAKFRKETCGDK